MAEQTTMQIAATRKWVRMSASKVRIVADLVKGKPLDEARRILAFTPKTASREVSKTLESAVANAEHNHQIPQDELIVAGVLADEGVTMRRFRPRAQGRAYRIRKRTCHIAVTVERTAARDEALPEPASTRKRGKAEAPADDKEED